MAYRAFKGKWQVSGDKAVISILPTGVICFNQVCYDRFIKPSGAKYVKLYYDAEAKKIAFEPLPGKTGELVLPINLTKTGLIAVVNGKAFLNHFGIEYQQKARSYPVHETYLTEPGSGYKRTWSEAKRKVIEIRLDEYIPDE